MMFFNKLLEKIVKCNTRLCVGIDPLVPPESSLLKNKNILDIVTESVDILIRQASIHNVPAVKFQSAYFEALGTDGFHILRNAIAHARREGILTILDAKRGDIASTMHAYGCFAFGYMDADCLTINPYMGIDTIEPLLPWLKASRGVYVVWVTSNKSAESLQFYSNADHSLFQDVHTIFSEFALDHSVEESVGFVLGATKLGRSVVRSFMETFSSGSLLLPGVGAQGAVVDSQLRGLLNRLPASLVPISREIGEISVNCQSLEEYEQKVSSAVGRLKVLLTL